MYKYIFGPVNSRRFGISLGIDLLGDKVCSFNCVYCEVEKTKVLTRERKSYVPVRAVIKELKAFFKTNPNIKLDYITLSGKGEPTLNKDIAKVIRHIKKRYSTKVCILTNASLLDLEEVRRDILEADLIVPSLDAVSQKAYKAVNLPEKLTKIDNIIEGIRKLREEFKGKLYLEILFVKNINDSYEEVRKLKDIASYLSLDGVQINTIHRPPAFSNYKPIDEDKREALQREFDLLLNSSDNYLPSSISLTDKAKQNDLWDRDNIVSKLNSLLSVRPCTFEDLYKVFCFNPSDKKELEYILNNLIINKTLLKEEYNSSVFYTLNK